MFSFTYLELTCGALSLLIFTVNVISVLTHCKELQQFLVFTGSYCIMSFLLILDKPEHFIR